ncbi:phytanoyl-CoA dioxygenase family protein [Pontibacter chitinilyticus]|uniref:phytanoyl-CoA dioxygenase family protein n=1 Tax=Pontibacter chitinilyticus TaxID=2674989 RepID=UPI00321C0A97
MPHTSYTIDGTRAFGSPSILVQEHDDLVAQVPWGANGYTVVPFLEETAHQKLLQGLQQLFLDALAQEGIAIPAGFELTQYHHLINGDQTLHLRVINHTKAIAYEQFPLPAQLLTDRIAAEVGLPLTTLNPNTGENIFHLRVIRPNRPDHNPLHRDAWLEELKGSINLYVPVAGSTDQSSLFVVPGSHYWPESDVERTLAGAVMNGAKYNVPGLTNTRKPLKLVRPNPGANQVLIFSPYLIHGGATNLNPDATRISLEIRLWRK